MKRLYVVAGGSPVAFWYVGSYSGDPYPHDQAMVILADLFAMLEQKQLLFVDCFASYSYVSCREKEIPISQPFQPDLLEYWQGMLERVDPIPAGAQFLNNDITVRGKSILYEDGQPTLYDGPLEVRFNLGWFPTMWLNLYATHFMPHYLDASAPNPDYLANYQRFRDFIEELTAKYPDLELVLDNNDCTPYAKMEGLEIKNLTYGDDGSMISIDISDD